MSGPNAPSTFVSAVVRAMTLRGLAALVLVTACDSTESKPEPAAKADAKADGKASAKADGKADAKADAKADGKADAKADGKADAKADGKADAKADGKADAKADGKADAKADPPAPDDPPAASDPDNAPPPKIADLGKIRPQVLAAPPWKQSALGNVSIKQGPEPKLKLIRKTKNAITDVDAWFSSLGAALPEWEVPNPRFGKKGSVPAEVPMTYESTSLTRALDLPTHAVFVYGSDFSSGRYLAATNRSFEIEAVFDFDAWSTAPKTAKGDAAFVHQEPQWAEVVDGILFVSHFHMTYAKSSGGDNAYLTAITLATGDILWRTDPLVSNSRNFVLRDGWILTGYGFTAEPDFVYLINAHDGAVAKKIKVKSGPEYFIVKGDTLYVRTYDMNYEFEL